MAFPHTRMVTINHLSSVLKSGRSSTSATHTLVAAVCLCLASTAAAADGDVLMPTEVGELYDYLDSFDAPRLAVASQGNFDSVHHLMPSKTVPAVVSSSDELIMAVRNGSVEAGLMSGLPTSLDGIAIFSSSLVSPRGMFTCKDPECDTVLEAIDAAIVRALAEGADAIAARANPPFDFISVHTCQTNVVSRFPFPTPQSGDRLANAAARGYLRIAALGPYNWSNSGDYTASPPTGFWPNVTAVIERHFMAAMGFGFQRVFNATSDGTMDLVANDLADITEPYWTIDAYYNGRSRQHFFATSCTTIGYDSTFLVRDLQFGASSSSSKDDVTTHGYFIAAVTVAAVLIVCIAVGYVLVKKREKRLYNEHSNVVIVDAAAVDSHKTYGEHKL